MKLLAFVGSETEIQLDRSQAHKRELIIKSASIYWNFKNIVRNVNDNVENGLVAGQNIVKFTDSYWSFSDIQSKFKSKGITLIGNYNKGTSSLKSTKDIKDTRKIWYVTGF